MRRLGNDLMRPKRALTPTAKALVCFFAAACGIAVGVVLLIPLHEGFGTLWTMLCAILAGIFYTRYTKLRREKRTEP